jgi:L-ascorbate metabolism protein UlaG (beta-lactamase superfamily)
MEITWYGGTCIRLRGREGVIVADAYRSIVGPTGRGITGDLVTYSHPDDQPLPVKGKRGAASDGKSVVRPTSLDQAFLLDGPGEYEVHDLLVNGVRTFRDDARGAERGLNTCFVYELDTMHTAHLGDIGHTLSEERLGEIGSVQIVCVPLGSALSAGRAAELVTQLDAKLIVPMSVGDDAAAAGALERFLHEMSVQHATPVPRLAVTISTLPQETTVAVLESRGKA